MSEHRPKSPFRKLVKILITASLILVACAGCVYLLYIYIVFHTGPYPADVANNKIIPRNGQKLCQALNKYYKKHEEYPPFLFGGENEWTNEYVKVIPHGSPSPDPLLAEGIIKEYPKNVAQGDIILPERWIDPRFDRSYNIVSSVVSTPNDYIARNYEIDISQKLEEYSGVSEDSPHARDLSKALEFLRAGGRLYAAGGLIDLKDDYTFRNPPGSQDFVPEYTTVTGELKKLRFFNSMYSMYGGTWVGNFGYARGEYLGKDRKSAYLWMYGARPTGNCQEYRKHLGLDLLNAESGELVPDGIPDAVLALYELKDGEVVNITCAEDM